MKSLDEITLIRVLCAALAAVVVLDALVVGAPGLGIVALPFVGGAVFFRRGGIPATVALALFGVVFALIGVSFAVSNGLSAGWADLLFAYLGTPIALAVVVFDVRHRVHDSHGHA